MIRKQKKKDWETEERGLGNRRNGIRKPKKEE
jgi:hypothetical protein